MNQPPIRVHPQHLIPMMSCHLWMVSVGSPRPHHSTHRDIRSNAVAHQVWDFVGLFLISWDVLYIPFEADSLVGVERFIERFIDVSWGCKGGHYLPFPIGK